MKGLKNLFLMFLGCVLITAVIQLFNYRILSVLLALIPRGLKNFQFLNHNYNTNLRMEMIQKYSAKNMMRI